MNSIAIQLCCRCSTDELELQEELVTLMPMVYEANAISEELNKQVCDTGTASGVCVDR